MIDLDYVMSGCSYGRMIHTYFPNYPKNLEYLKKWIDVIREESKFSFLYNAYSENKFPKTFEALEIDKMLDSIYSDSGGLQMVTQQKSITEKAKDKIYMNQGQHSNFAMSFDEVPVKTTYKSSLVNSLDSRYFDRDILKECAIKSSENFKRQIDTFIDMKSNTLPIFIIHGQTMEDMKTWLDTCIDNLNSDELRYMNTVAVSSTSNGYGILDEIEKYFYLKRLNLESITHLHLLGVGSIGRIAPVILNKFDNIRLSYDSTTHARGAIQGGGFIDNRTYRLGRAFGPRYIRLYNEINSVVDMEITAEEFYDSFNMPTLEYIEKHKNEGIFISTLGIILHGVYGFVKRAKAMNESKDVMIEEYEEYGPILEHFFNEVTTLDDFNAWHKDAKLLIRETKRIKDHKENTLEGLI